eukprot:TRINITY_DN6835_c0_g1_i1.p1 TRINITY_DN6835_c0_g1~~TRINITY_DN6835_c0_g1_i1.p1  ORF type:complete len:141 (-),score=6.16 TRINITY_DN6835_c0_g1_i1:418-840(-)
MYSLAFVALFGVVSGQSDPGLLAFRTAAPSVIGLFTLIAVLVFVVLIAKRAHYSFVGDFKYNKKIFNPQTSYQLLTVFLNFLWIVPLIWLHLVGSLSINFYKHCWSMVYLEWEQNTNNLIHNFSCFQCPSCIGKVTCSRL